MILKTENFNYIQIFFVYFFLYINKAYAICNFPKKQASKFIILSSSNTGNSSSHSTTSGNHILGFLNGMRNLFDLVNGLVQFVSEVSLHNALTEEAEHQQSHND
uniref:Acetyl-coenzyme A synthetase n=1 Tax=Zeugodacus cucurbitae TaxID=28588 RepID=A0A0A1XGW9_ZEUCU